VSSEAYFRFNGIDVGFAESSDVGVRCGRVRMQLRTPALRLTRERYSGRSETTRNLTLPSLNWARSRCPTSDTFARCRHVDGARRAAHGEFIVQRGEPNQQKLPRRLHREPAQGARTPR
jgi:hypothetical protein